MIGLAYATEAPAACVEETVDGDHLLVERVKITHFRRVAGVPSAIGIR
jgi:hypothetical protein